MGLFTNEIIFDFPAPTLDKIIKEITKISGLSVIEIDPINNKNQINDSLEDDEELHNFYQYISFECIPNHPILIYDYVQNAINDFVEKEKLESGFNANWPQPLHGADEENGKQSIYIESYAGTETTLFLATNNALNSLGGVSRYEKSISYAIKKYPITIDDLKNNHKKVKRKILFSYLLSIVMLPITIPLVIIKMVISLFKMPFKISQSIKAVKNHYPDKFKDK